MMRRETGLLDRVHDRIAQTLQAVPMAPLGGPPQAA